MTARFRFIYRPGTASYSEAEPEVVGAVRGNGGFVATMEPIVRACRRAREGNATGLPEAVPGAVQVYPAWSPAADGPGVWVRLRDVDTVRVLS